MRIKNMKNNNSKSRFIKPKKERINIRLPRKLVGKMNEYAKEKGLTYSDILERAAEKILKEV